MYEDGKKGTRETGGGKPMSPKVFADLDAQLGKTGWQGSLLPAGDLGKRFGILEALLHVSTTINSTLDLERLLEIIVDAVIMITGCKHGYLMLAEKKDEFYVALGRAGGGQPLSHENFDASLSVIKKAAATGQPQLVGDAQQEDDLKNKRSIVDLNIRTVISIPLLYQDNLVGVIYADSDTISETFNRSDLPLLDAFGAQAAVAIQNAKTRGELEKIRTSLERQNISLRQQLAEKYEFSGIIGRSPAMQGVFSVITKVAPLSTTVLIQGETGTGKELIARAIHFNSNRKDRGMVSINCGALPKHILESELFGYRKGAFTGADEDRGGLFEAANGGTLLLDEIGEMPIELQVKLLRVLQDGEVRRVGDDRPIKVDVRVIAATNRDLAKEVEEGKFRNDLFYRLNVVPMFLPPLRDRPEDVLPLTELFLERHSKRMNRPKPILTRSAKELLLTHSWAGNVRELENTIERALALGEGRDTIDIDQFLHLADSEPPFEVPEEEVSLKAMALIWEKQFIRKNLVRNSWNVKRTASVLQISRQQLHNKIKKHGLSPEI